MPQSEGEQQKSLASITTEMTMEESSTSTFASSMPPIPRHIIIKHEDDIIEVANNDMLYDDLDSQGTTSNNGVHKKKVQRSSIPTNLPLVDEIDLQQILISPPPNTLTPFRTRASAIQGVMIGKKQLEVLCNHAAHKKKDVQQQTIDGGGGGFQACPCCKRFVQRDTIAAVDAAANQNASDVVMKDDVSENGSKARGEAANQPPTNSSAFLSNNHWWTNLGPKMQHMAAPPLVTNDQIQQYTIKETIVQGWLYKKGTGDDWAGRRWWKPRWVTLALATSPKTIVPTPCLISHRAPGVPYPASIIQLTQSTVIMAIERTTHQNIGTHNESDRLNVNNGSPGCTTNNKSQQHTPTKKEEWNRHCFQIVHTHQGNSDTDGSSNCAAAATTTTTRIFTAPLTERNEWVFALNNTLLSYEKGLSQARMNQVRMEQIRQVKTKKARRLNFDGLLLCGELMEGEVQQAQQQQKLEKKNKFVDGYNSQQGSIMPVSTPSSGLDQQQQQEQTSPIVSQQQSAIIGGRMKSPSPTRHPQQRGNKNANGMMLGGGLPPTSPRSRLNDDRSPSPIRMSLSSSSFITP